MKYFSTIFMMFVISYFRIEMKLCNFETEHNYCMVDNFDKASDIQIECDSTEKYSDLIVWPNVPLTLNDTLNVKNCSFSGLYLFNIQSINLEKKILNYSIGYLYVRNSDFSFSYGLDGFVQNFFSSINIEIIKIDIDVKYFLNTQTIIFKDAYVKYLTFRDMVDSKLKSNYLSFEKTKNIENLNSTIQNLDIFLFKVKLDQKLLDKDVFKRMKIIYISHQVDHIATGTFSSFEYLKELSLIIFSLKSLFHNSNTKWMLGLNANINVNYSNDSNSVNQEDQTVVCFREFNNNVYLKIDEYRFPDEDFCQFVYFPHQNAVFPIFYNCHNTCTFQWLIQYNRHLKRIVYNFCSYNLQVKCDFEKMVSSCYFEKSVNMNWNYSHLNFDLYYMYDRNYKNKIYDYVLSLFLIPILCLFAISTNSINILVLRKFEKDAKNAISKQMLICSYVDLTICVIYVLGLTLKCIEPIGYFCTISLINYKPYRYAMLTITNYLGNVLKTYSKLVQILIKFERFIISTTPKNKILVKLSEINTKAWTLFFLSFSCLINFIKLFEYEYEINHDIDIQLRFPSANPYYFNFKFVYSYFNIFSIIMNNLLLILIQTIIDIYLIRFVHKSTKAKKKLGIILKHEKNPAERKMKLMIIYTGIVVLLLHSPDLIISLSLAFTFYSYKYNLIAMDFFTFVLKNISDVCYIISFSLNMFLYYAFNTHFKRKVHDVFQPFIEIRYKYKT